MAAGWWRAVWCAALILYLMGLTSAPARAAGTTITAFYTVSQADYDAWDGLAPPPQTAAFPPGTSRIAYYLAYTGAIPGFTTFQVTEYAPDGRISEGYVHHVDQTTGAVMVGWHYNIAFPPGTYRFAVRVNTVAVSNLLLEGLPVASTTFHIASGVAVLTFRTISVAAYTGLLSRPAGAAAPARTATFAADTPRVPYYFEYAGALPGRTRWQIIARDAAGAIVYRSPRYQLNYVVGWAAYYVPFDSSLPVGPYRLELRLDGRTRSTAAATITPVALSSACLPVHGSAPGRALYASTGAAFDRWRATGYAPPPRVLHLPATTTRIAWYLRYSAATPGSTYFQVTLTSLRGSVFQTGTTYTVQCAAGSWMGYFHADAPFPRGAYELDLLLDGGQTGTSARVAIT